MSSGRARIYLPLRLARPRCGDLVSCSYVNGSRETHVALRRCSPSLHTPLPRRPLLLSLAGRLPALLRRRKSRLPGGPGGAHSPVRPWRTHLSHRTTPPRLDGARRERISSQRTGCEQVHAVAPDGRHGGVRREGRGPLLVVRRAGGRRLADASRPGVSHVFHTCAGIVPGHDTHISRSLRLYLRDR